MLRPYKLQPCGLQFLTGHQIPTDELSPARLPLALVASPYLANRASHRYTQKRQALCGLLSLILPDRITRCTIRNTPILIDSEGRSVSNATRRYGFRNKRMSYVSCLRLLLTVSAGRVTINILPDDVLLHIFLIDGYQHQDFIRSYVKMEDGDRVERLSWTPGGGSG
jgi:hypothetical protein